MELTIHIRDDLYEELEMVTKHDQSSIGIEIEKAVLMLTQKRALVQRLMNETCDEFNHAMRRLGSQYRHDRIYPKDELNRGL